MSGHDAHPLTQSGSLLITSQSRTHSRGAQPNQQPNILLCWLSTHLLLAPAGPLASLLIGRFDWPDRKRREPSALDPVALAALTGRHSPDTWPEKFAFYGRNWLSCVELMLSVDFRIWCLVSCTNCASPSACSALGGMKISYVPLLALSRLPTNQIFLANFRALHWPIASPPLRSQIFCPAD